MSKGRKKTARDPDEAPHSKKKSNNRSPDIYSTRLEDIPVPRNIHSTELTESDSCEFNGGTMNSSVVSNVYMEATEEPTRSSFSCDATSPSNAGDTALWKLFEEEKDRVQCLSMQIARTKSSLNPPYDYSTERPKYSIINQCRNLIRGSLLKELAYRKRIRETLGFRDERNELNDRIAALETEAIEWVKSGDSQNPWFKEWEIESTHLNELTGLLKQEVDLIPQVPPDSQKIDKLLPSESVISDGMHFVGREPSMLQLLDIHWSMFQKREIRSGPADLIPLVDAVYGMGKSKFGMNYLATFSSYLKRKKFVDERYSKPFIDELLTARTLIIIPERRIFESSTTEGMMMNIIAEQLIIAVGETWGIPRPSQDHCESLEVTLKWISNISPVFIVFDEIGNAAERIDRSLVATREKFFEFVNNCCAPIWRTNRIYYMLSGRAAYLSLVGMRPCSDYLRGSPAATFVRVNLNPIRADHILKILQKTKLSKSGLTYFECLIGKEMNPEDFCSKLYDATGGHPRTLNSTLCKQDWFSIPPTDPEAIKLDDVYEVLNNYASYIRLLYDFARSSSEIDLTAFISAEPKQPTFEYLATRIYAGFGLEKTKTTIFIMPTIMRVLDEYFLPLTELLCMQIVDELSAAVDELSTPIPTVVMDQLHALITTHPDSIVRSRSAICWRRLIECGDCEEIDIAPLIPYLETTIPHDEIIRISMIEILALIASKSDTAATRLMHAIPHLAAEDTSDTIRQSIIKLIGSILPKILRVDSPLFVGVDQGRMEALGDVHPLVVGLIELSMKNPKSVCGKISGPFERELLHALFVDAGNFFIIDFPAPLVVISSILDDYLDSSVHRMRIWYSHL